MIVLSKSFELDDGRKITLETGKLAKQADGSAVIKMGDTMLLATVCAKNDARDDVDFLPLSVDYREKYAASGRFPGGFFKREARPSSEEILISRLIDRALRPLFPSNFHADIQVQVTLISAGTETLPDALACLAASTAVMVSNIPFNGPVSEVRVAKLNGEYIINPSISDLPQTTLEMMVAASEENIVMMEGEMKEVAEVEMIEAIKFAHQAIKIQCQAQKELAQEVEKARTKREYCHETNDAELKENIFNAVHDKLTAIVLKVTSKHERSDAFAAIKQDFIDSLSEDEQSEKASMINRYFNDVEKDVVRKVILNNKVRLDGRKTNEIRPIWSEINYLPSAHGSAIFTRGETQSLSTVTLGTKLDEQIIDGAVLEGKNKFILHYNFPSFATGEVKPIRGLSRREVGHGNLAQRALKYVLPADEDNPYTIRVVSDILESNGSSSMATVCAGCLALMDAGVQIKKPVSGIAMGLIVDDDNKNFAILSDILGDEDHLGDMDFKVTGTEDGITACQMDIKVEGLPYEILEQALEQARKGRLHILNEMAKTIKEPREDYKPHVPRIVKKIIDKEFIGAIIGPGGKIIQELQRETNSTIVIEEVDGKGIIDIVAVDRAAIDAVLERIEAITAVPEVGKIYKGKVKTITSYGAFVEIIPGKDGLLHISEINWTHLQDVESVLKVGQIIEVKLIDVDKKSGKLKLSRKVLLPRPEKN